MKTPIIGILAGMGPRSTAPFIDLLVSECQRQYGARDDIDFPPIMVYSLPTPFYADRPIDHAAMEAALHAGLADLGRAGADFMAIACNTAHIYYPALARQAPAPLLNMVALTAEALPTTTGKVALIAARPTVESGIYQAAIADRGCQCIDLGWQDDVDTMIESLRGELDAASLSDRWNAFATQARNAGADTIVVACADLSAVSVPLDMPVVDATHALASEIIGRWLRSRRA